MPNASDINPRSTALTCNLRRWPGTSFPCYCCIRFSIFSTSTALSRTRSASQSPPAKMPLWYTILPLTIVVSMFSFDEAYPTGTATDISGRTASLRTVSRSLPKSSSVRRDSAFRRYRNSGRPCPRSPWPAYPRFASQPHMTACRRAFVGPFPMRRK